MSSQPQIDGTLFDFGTITQTQILKVQDQLSLPYNPFTFDINLRIIKSIEPYQSNISFNVPSGCKSIFGRKKTEVEYVLKAPTVSSKHFAIDENKKIYDLGSAKGTFIWIKRDKPIEIDKNQKFLIGKVELKIISISLHERKAVLKVNDKIVQICTKQNPLLLGSNKRCVIKIQGKDYYAAIDMINMRLYTFLESEDCDWEKGVWLRLSQRREQSEGRMLFPEDIIMVFPYIFITQY